MNKNEGTKFKNVAYAILAFLVALFVLSAVLIYGFDLKKKWVEKLEEIIPFPAAIIDQKKVILISEFSQNSDSVRQFYENQDFSKLGMRVDFNTADGQKRLRIKEREVLEKMIEDQAIHILAQQEGIEVTQKDLDDNVDKKLEEYGNLESVRDELRRLYGWTIEDFKLRIVRPSLYREALKKVYESKYQNAEESKKKIAEAEKMIVKKEKSFSEIVSQFSEGSTAEAGGELGWFKKDQIISEIAENIFSLKKGEISPILESQLGFHIVEMEEKKKEQGEELVRIRQIFASKKTFPDWIGERMKTMKIRILIRGYYWDEADMKVEFSDQKMREFEDQIMKDPKGDASVIF